MERVRILLKSFDHSLVESSLVDILASLEKVKGQFSGPVPLPVKIKKYTVLRSPHVDKDSREQFEIRIHKRLLDVLNPNDKVIDVLQQLRLPTGVDVEIK